ncbi:glucosamine-6-phosphate isomerase 1 [Echria macrotheca]|uniref:Glucosamine-6-phosphate isomerase n=1 Tax=Echria macrotheca TaxID=438768 RepID=A0AAJ0F5F4_9PEZI|nr:glucosamine-6-phosphate isomerase 1 [Echria macrotheca]
MRLIIRDDAEAASAYAANYIVQRIKEFAPIPSNPFVLGLPTGSSPLGIYRILVDKFKAGEVSFENVVTFNMDEYMGIPRDHPQSYHTFMWHHLFRHININPQNVHILNGNAPDAEAECLAYESAILAAGGIDLFLAGIGEDGHIAFNEPGSSLASRTRPKTLAYDTVLANSRFFDSDIDKVPRMALTVGVQTVMDAREVVAIVLGARKAPALQKCVEGGVNHMWTLSALQLHPHAMIVCDDDAVLELQVKTVKYFKSIEQVARSQGFEQSLPSKLRTRNTNPSINEPLVTTNGTANWSTNSSTYTPPPTIHDAPQSALLAARYPIPVERSKSPVFDSMSSRIQDGPVFVGVMTPPDELPDQGYHSDGSMNGSLKGHTNESSERAVENSNA